MLPRVCSLPMLPLTCIFPSSEVARGVRPLCAKARHWSAPSKHVQEQIHQRLPRLAPLYWVCHSHSIAGPVHVKAVLCRILIQLTLGLAHFAACALTVLVPTVGALVDQTRVLLQGKDGDYINANHVVVSHSMTVWSVRNVFHGCTTGFWFGCLILCLRAIRLPKVEETGQRYILTQVSTFHGVGTQIEQSLHCAPLLCSCYI